MVKIKDIQEIKNCPACGGDNLVHIVSREQVVCKECGLVHEPFSSVAKEVLEITRPSIETGAPVATEKVAVKVLFKAQEKKLKLKKAKTAKKAKKKIKKIKPAKKHVKKPKVGFRARLKRLIKRKKT